jgi:hypothetical protein
MPNVALQDGKVILKDGNVSCTCCGGVVCPPITSEYNVISEEMYNALQAGGSYSATGYGSEYTGCAFSGTSSGTIASGNCGASVGVSGGVTCTIGGVSYNSQIYIGWSIAQVGSEYRFTYYGGGSCFSGIYPGQCYTVGFFIGWFYDNISGFGTNVGTATITTSAGSMSFGIWNLDFSATAGLDITIS